MGAWEAPGKTDEWYTPPEVFSALGVTFDLDVASPPGGPPHVPTRAYIAPPRDGLTEPWHGLVWMNPPYGGRDGIRPWLERFTAHGNGIALLPDRTSAGWFGYALDHVHGVLFTRARVRFIRPGNHQPHSPSNGTALFAMGAAGMQALRNADAAGFGTLLTRPGYTPPNPPPSAAQPRLPLPPAGADPAA